MLRLIMLSIVGLVCHPAAAQDYPSKQIKLVVQFSAGGGADLIARMIGAELQTTFNQAVVVDNRPGANGAIANQAVASAPPDGYTLLVSAAGPMVVNPHLYGKAAVDTIRDFVPIAGLAESKFTVVVHPDLPVRTIQELTAYAKSRPGKLNYSSSGSGGSPHLAGELYRAMAGVDMVHIPYKGLSPAITDLIGAKVDLTFADIIVVAPFLKAGQIRAIGITGLRRSPLLPDVATLNESGLPGYQAGTWYALHGSASLPPAIVEKLNLAVRAILARPAVKARLAVAGLEGVDLTPAQFAAYQQADYDKWGKLIKSAGIKGE